MCDIKTTRNIKLLLYTKLLLLQLVQSSGKISCLKFESYKILFSDGGSNIKQNPTPPFLISSQLLKSKLGENVQFSCPTTGTGKWIFKYFLSIENKCNHFRWGCNNLVMEWKINFCRSNEGTEVCKLCFFPYFSFYLCPGVYR